RGEEPRISARIAPLELVWTAASETPGAEGDLVMLSLSPSGRFFGLAADFTLWKAGRNGAPVVQRVDYAGEGITSFPGAQVPGFFFVRGGTFAWGSDLDAAQRGVDRLLAAESGAGASAGAPILALFPGDDHRTMRGVMMQRDGSLERLLLRLAPAG